MKIQYYYIYYCYYYYYQPQTDFEQEGDVEISGAELIIQNKPVAAAKS